MNLRNGFLSFFKGAFVAFVSFAYYISTAGIVLSFGIYEELLDATGNFFWDIKKNYKIMFPFIFGAIAGILSNANLIPLVLYKVQVQVNFLFIGIMVGGISLITEKKKLEKKAINIVIMILLFILLVLSYLFLSSMNEVNFNISFINILLVLGVGVLTGIGVLIPGIGSHFVLDKLGYLNLIFRTFGNLLNTKYIINSIAIALPFIIGIIIGLVITGKLISYLIKKYESKTYYGLIGLVCSSIVLILINTKPFTINVLNIGFCIFAFLWGYLLVKNLDKE